MHRRNRPIRLLLLSLLLVFLCPAMVFAAKDAQYDEKALKETAFNMLNTAISICSDDAAFDEMFSYREAQLDYILTANNIPMKAADFKKLLTSWKGAQDECGSFNQVGELQNLLEGFTIEESNGDINLVGEFAFSERAASVTFTFDDDGTLEALTVGGKYSTGEILKKAGLNTLIGMGTVFCVLILISLLISTFRFIPAIQQKFTKKTEAASAAKKAEKAAHAAAPAAASAAAAVAAAPAQPLEPLSIPDGAVVNVTVRERQVTYVTVREL